MEKQIIDKIAWMRIENKKLLCVRTRGKNAFYNPGGKREGNETDIDALAREVREECGVEIIPSSVKSFAVYTAHAHGKPENVLVQMTCYSGDYTGTLTPSSEIEEIAWLDCSDFDKISEVGIMIFKDLQAQGLIN